MKKSFITSGPGFVVLSFGTNTVVYAWTGLCQNELSHELLVFITLETIHRRASSSYTLARHTATRHMRYDLPWSPLFV